MLRKILLVTVVFSFFFGTLFYLSNISFQLEAFRWKLWAVELSFFLSVAVIAGFISFRHGNRWKKK